RGPVHSLRLPQGAGVRPLGASVEPIGVALSVREVSKRGGEITRLAAAHWVDAPLRPVHEDQVHTAGAGRPDSPARRAVGQTRRPRPSPRARARHASGPHQDMFPPPPLNPRHFFPPPSARHLRYKGVVIPPMRVWPGRPYPLGATWDGAGV